MDISDIWKFAVGLLLFILGMFAREIYKKKNTFNTEHAHAIMSTQENLKILNEQESKHRLIMDAHCVSTDKNAEKQTKLLEDMAKMLDRIENHTRLTAEGMLQNRRSNGDLALAIEKLAAKLK